MTALYDMVSEGEPVGALSELIRLHGIADLEIDSLVEQLLEENLVKATRYSGVLQM